MTSTVLADLPFMDAFATPGEAQWRAAVEKVLKGGIRMPLSIVGVDVWGEDIVGSSHVFASGDMDGICAATGRGPLPVSWTLKPSAVVPLWLFKENGDPFLADPRQALANIVRQYHELGLRPVVRRRRLHGP